VQFKCGFKEESKSIDEDGGDSGDGVPRNRLKGGRGGKISLGSGDPVANQGYVNRGEKEWGVLK